MDSPAFALVTAPGFVASLAEVPLVDLRSRRQVAHQVEDSLSYLRRLVQGRLELVEAELARRGSGRGPSSADHVVRTLSSTFGENACGAGSGRPPSRVEAPEDPGLTEELDAVLAPADLAALGDLADSELAFRLAGLSDVERAVSARRRQVLDVVDRLGAELARRYRVGEATVDALLAEPRA